MQKLDQSSTAGRAAFRDVEVRGYLQPKLWVDTQMGMLIDPDPTNSDGAPSTIRLTYQQADSLTYPYLPPGCCTLITVAVPQTADATIGSETEAAELPCTPTSVPNFQPQLQCQYISLPGQSDATPLAVNVLPTANSPYSRRSTPSATYVGRLPDRCGVNTLTPFAATEVACPRLRSA